MTDNGDEVQRERFSLQQKELWELSGYCRKGRWRRQQKDIFLLSHRDSDVRGLHRRFLQYRDEIWSRVWGYSQLDGVP